MSLHPAPFHTATSHFSDPKTRKIVQRWAVLAKQRLDYLTELFDSGRWRRFHSEADFLDNIQEAKDSVERWQAMVNGVYVAPVIREAPPVRPIIAAMETAASQIHAPVAQHEAEVLSFENHAAQRDALRRPHLVAMSDVIVNHADVGESAKSDEAKLPVHAVSPLDLFDHDAIVARYPMLRAAGM